MKRFLNNAFVRYVLTGGTAFVLEYLMYRFLKDILTIHYIMASVVVYSILFWFVFLVNRNWSFKSNGKIGPQLIKYLALFIFNIIVGNIWLMRFLTETIGLSSNISPFIKMSCIVLWNFIIYKYFIYKD